MMTKEETEFNKFKKRIRRSIHEETIRQKRQSFVYALIRETDDEDQKIASIVGVKESQVHDARKTFRQLRKEQPDKRIIDHDYDELLKDIAEVRELNRHGRCNAKAGDGELIVSDEEIAFIGYRKFIQNFIKIGEMDDRKIASLIGVDESFVTRVRQSIS